MKFPFNRTLISLSLLGALPSIASADLNLQYESAKDTVSNWVAPKIVISNDANAPVNLDNVVIEYYFFGSEYETSASDFHSEVWYTNAQDEDGIEFDIDFVHDLEAPMKNGYRSNFKLTTSFSDANYIPAGGEFKLNYAFRKTDWELINSQYDYSYIDSDDSVTNSNIIVRDTSTNEVLWGFDLEGRFETFWQGGHDGYEYFERSGDEILETADYGFITTIDNIGYNREDAPEDNFAHLVKTNQQGEVEWETELKDLNTTTLAALDSGYLVVGAKETYSNNLDPWQWDLASSFEVIQISEQGQVVSSFEIPSDKRIDINKMIETRDGGFLVLFNETGSRINDGVYGHSITNGAVLKLNADLSVAWKNSFEVDTFFTDIDVLFSNRIAVTGAKRVIANDNSGNPYYSFDGAFIKELDQSGNLVTYADYPQVNFGQVKYGEVNVELGDDQMGTLMLASNVYTSSRSPLNTRLLKLKSSTLEVLGETLLTGEDVFEVQDLIDTDNSTSSDHNGDHDMIICGDNKLARMDFNGPVWLTSFEGAVEESDLTYSDLRGLAATRDGGFVITGHQAFGEEQAAWILKVDQTGQGL